MKYHGVLMQKNRQSIMESCLFGNKYILYRNSPIFISSFCKSNIKTVRDIWNIQTNSFHAPELVRDRLLDHIGWNAKYNKIKTSFSPDIIEILKGPYAQHQTPSIQN